MARLIFEIIFIAFGVTMGVIRRPFEKRNKANVIITDRKGTQEKGLLMLTFIGVSLIPLIYILSPWLNFTNYKLPLIVNILGVLLLIPAGFLFYRSHKDLGHNWSVTMEIRDEHQLITKGVYRYIRHPMYSALWLASLCQPLLLQNYIAGFSGIFGFGMLYFLRVGKEEKMMEEQFGEEYLNYKKKTHRLIPKVY